MQSLDPDCMRVACSQVTLLQQGKAGHGRHIRSCAVTDHECFVQVTALGIHTLLAVF